jgi:hypothetical protein
MDASSDDPPGSSDAPGRRRFGHTTMSSPACRAAGHHRPRSSMSKPSFSLSPEDRTARPRPAQYLIRACAAHVRSHVDKVPVEKAADKLFGRGDAVTQILTRGAAAPATTTSAVWAGPIAAVAIEDLVMAISSTSAAAGLFARGLKVNLDGIASLRIPGRIVDANDAGKWVGEGQPVPLRTQRMTVGQTLTLHKLVVITAYTSEMIASSNIEAISRSLVTEAAALALDKALFGTQADDGVTPAGILNGVTPITPVAGGGLTALAGDVKNLVAALVAAGAGREFVLVCNPTQATSLKLLTTQKFDVPVLQSSSVPAGTMIAVETSSLVSAFGTTPEFEIAPYATLHFEDATPTDIVPPGGPAAVPVKSMFQTDNVSLRMTLAASWALRASGHVQVVNSVTW